MTRVGDHTPWGPAQDVEQLREGVELVQTARHGGVRLRPEVAATLPTGYRSFTGHPPNVWHEEDVDMPMILWFLRLGHDARLFACGEAMSQLNDRTATNWKALKEGRQARMLQAAKRANARIRAARARALAEAAA